MNEENRRLELALAGALLRAPGWRIDRAKALSVRALCLTGECRHLVDESPQVDTSRRRRR